MDNLSEHFSEDELDVTDSGIVNECPEELIPNATKLANDILEGCRILIGPLHVNSWFRNHEVNAHCGGDPNSAHLEARAADVVPNGNVLNAFKMIVVSDIKYDKVIYEKRNSEWIHIQIRGGGDAPRRLAFTAHRGPDGNMVYEAYDS